MRVLLAVHVPNRECIGLRPGGMFTLANRQGASEWWWMRICADGSRVDVTEPRAVAASFPYPTPAHFDAADPRVFKLSADDVACRLKVKCRPVRVDGEGGYPATSKPTPEIAPDTRERA